MRAMTIPIAKETRYLSEKRIRRIAAGKAGSLFAPARVEGLRLWYKRFYFAKFLALAARTPFPPKRIGYVLFYDAHSGEGGLTNGVPVWAEKETDPEAVLPEAYSREDFLSRQGALVEKHILRQYLLKRPDLKLEGIETVYLPYYECDCDAGGIRKKIFVNAASGDVSVSDRGRR